MDASVTPIPDEPNLSLVQTTDFFYPLIDDPYLQVKNNDFEIKGGREGINVFSVKICVLKL